MKIRGTSKKEIKRAVREQKALVRDATEGNLQETVDRLVVLLGESGLSLGATWLAVMGVLDPLEGHPGRIYVGNTDRALKSAFKRLRTTRWLAELPAWMTGDELDGAMTRTYESYTKERGRRIDKGMGA